MDAVVPGEVAADGPRVQRAGLRAVQVEVASPPTSTRIARGATSARCSRSADAAGRRAGPGAGGVRPARRGRGAGARDRPDEVQFHEVGAWDSIADVVGVCAALADLGVTGSRRARSRSGPGAVRTAHGDLPVPAPAVLELARGWEVLAGGNGELATPTGMALVRALAEALRPAAADARSPRSASVPGTRDVAGRANVIRVVLGAGRPAPSRAPRCGCWRPTWTTWTRGCGPPCSRAAGRGRGGRLAGADPDEEGPAGAHPVRAGRRRRTGARCASRCSR